jgi:AcrR family transcriptional regulator
MTADDAARSWPSPARPTPGQSPEALPSGPATASAARSHAAGGEGKPEGVYARRTRIRKQEILDSALIAFGHKGFYKASLADVASAAGITAAGLLHHFKTKEALLVELLRQRDLVDLEESFGGEHPRGRTLLQHLVDTMARNMTRVVTTQMYAVLSAEGVTDAHPARQWFIERYQELRQVIATALVEAVEEGSIGTDVDPEPTAAAMIAVMDGVQIQWLYDPDAVDMAEITCRTFNALARPVVPLVPRREPPSPA